MSPWFNHEVCGSRTFISKEKIPMEHGITCSKCHRFFIPTSFVIYKTNNGYRSIVRAVIRLRVRA